MGLVAKESHRKFENAKDFHLFKGEKSLGIFKINEKNLDDEVNELMGFVKLTGADRVFLIWTARGGVCNEEVVI